MCILINYSIPNKFYLFESQQHLFKNYYFFKIKWESITSFSLFKNNLLITKSSCDVKYKEIFIKKVLKLITSLIYIFLFSFSLVELVKNKNSLDGRFVVC